MRKKRLFVVIALLTLAKTAVADLHTKPLPSDFFSSSPNVPSFDNGSTKTAQSFGSPSSMTVTVQFDNRSSIVKPSFNDESILADAQNAALITVRGRTSTP